MTAQPSFINLYFTFYLVLFYFAITSPQLFYFAIAFLLRHAHLQQSSQYKRESIPSSPCSVSDIRLKLQQRQYLFPSHILSFSFLQPTGPVPSLDPTWFREGHLVLTNPEESYVRLNAFRTTSFPPHLPRLSDIYISIPQTLPSLVPCLRDHTTLDPTELWCCLRHLKANQL